MSIAALKALLKRGRYDNEAIYDVLIKQRQKGYSKLTDREKGQYDMLYETFGYKEMEMLEDRLFYALGKHPELDDLFKAGKYLDDDALSSMFSRKIDSVLDDFAVRAERLKGRADPHDEAFSLLDELLDDDLVELLKERKSINDISGGFFTDDMMTVDHEGRLDVLIEALNDLQDKSFDALSPEFLAHNLRGIKAHINTLPKAQRKRQKTSGTVDDTDFWDEDYEYDIGDIRPRDKDLMDIRYDATGANVAKEGKYTPVDLPVEGTMDPSNQIQWDPNPRQPGDFSEIEAAARRIKEIEAEAATAPDMMRQVYSDPESYAKGEKILEKTGAEMDAIEAEIARLKKKKTGGIVKKTGGGIMSGPLYNRDF